MGRASCRWTCPSPRTRSSRPSSSPCASNGLDSCYIRPIAYLGYGEMGLNPTPVQGAGRDRRSGPGAPTSATRAIANGIRLKVSSWARHDPRAMPTAAKGTGMYINSSLAKVEAMRAGYDEALMCTTGGLISEGTGENVFVVRDGRIFMPPASAVGALEGITADSVIDDRPRPRLRGHRARDAADGPVHGRRGLSHRDGRRGGPDRLGRRPPGRHRRARADHPRDPGDRSSRRCAARWTDYKDWLEYVT